MPAHAAARRQPALGWTLDGLQGMGSAGMPGVLDGRLAHA